jgi:diamine N-acetyltransferase
MPILKTNCECPLTKNPDTNPNPTPITLHPVSRDNWRQVAELQVTPEQREHVGDPCYYLALCHYEELWQPLAIYLDKQLIGGLMWAVDPADNSCWFGGFYLDHRYQNQGYGRLALQTAIAMFSAEHGHQQFALSYHPYNLVAKHLYSTLGFTETEEWEGDEIVARLHKVT